MSTIALSADEVIERSHGEVSNPESYSYRTFLPARWGLYCEEIFGPVAWKSGEMALERDERSERWGHLVLSTAVTHPRKEGATLTAIPVAPPAFRRFRQMDRVEHRAYARARRAKILAAPPGCDPPEKILEEEGLLDERAIEQLEGGLIEPELNTQYRAIISVNRRATRLAEIGAPKAVVDEERARVRDAVHTLFDTLEQSDAFDPETRARALALHDPRWPRIAPAPRASTSQPSNDELRAILMEEVPELRLGLVSITAIDRRGSTYLVRVQSTDADIDAVRACEGVADSRRKAIRRRLGGLGVEFEPA